MNKSEDHDGFDRGAHTFGDLGENDLQFLAGAANFEEFDAEADGFFGSGSELELDIIQAAFFHNFARR